MLLKEDEARNMRCCGPEGCGSKRPSAGGTEERFCIASACMAWRWAGWSSLTQCNTADEFIPSDGNSPPRLQPKPPDDDWTWRQQYPPDQRQWFGWTNWEKPHHENSRGCCGYAPDEEFSRLKGRLERAESKLAAKRE